MASEGAIKVSLSLCKTHFADLCVTSGQPAPETLVDHIKVEYRQGCHVWSLVTRGMGHVRGPEGLMVRSAAGHVEMRQRRARYAEPAGGLTKQPRKLCKRNKNTNKYVRGIGKPIQKTIFIAASP